MALEIFFQALIVSEENQKSPTALRNHYKLQKTSERTAPTNSEEPSNVLKDLRKLFKAPKTSKDLLPLEKLGKLIKILKAFESSTNISERSKKLSKKSYIQITFQTKKFKKFSKAYIYIRLSRKGFPIHLSERIHTKKDLQLNFYLFKPCSQVYKRPKIGTSKISDAESPKYLYKISTSHLQKLASKM